MILIVLYCFSKFCYLPTNQTSRKYHNLELYTPNSDLTRHAVLKEIKIVLGTVPYIFKSSIKLYLKDYIAYHK